MTTAVKLKLLGGLQAADGSGCPIPLSARKAAALLAYLAVQQKPQSRDKLTALLWGDSAEAQARASLRQALTALRKALGEGALWADGHSVSLADGAVRLDVAEFEAAVAADATADLRRAVQLYEGDLLDGFHVRAEGFDEWVLFERERLRTRALAVMRALLEREAAAGALEEATAVAVRLLALDPLQEAVHRELMRLYLRSGRRGSALRQYKLCRELLERELGVRPGPETERAYRELQTEPAGGAGAVALETRRPAASAASAPPPGAREVGSEPMELRQLTVLALAWTPSAELGDTSDEPLAAAIHAAERVLLEYGASITRRLPDGLLATFGVPFARARDAELAVHAAAALQRAPVCDALQWRVGIDCGQAMIEPGPGLPLVVGKPLTRAAALRANAEAGEVRLSEAVRQAVAGGVTVEAAGSDGAWRLVRVRDRAWTAASSPLVGRRTELRLLSGALEVCVEAGAGHTFWLRGEAGMGKSRLLAEALRVAEDLGFSVVFSRWLDFGVGSPAGPIRQLLLGLMGLPEDASAAELARAIVRVLEDGSIGGERAVFLEELLDVPLAPVSRAVADALDPEARRAGQREVLAQLVRSACQQGPLALAVEDVHWANGEAAAQLVALIEAAAGCRAVVMLTSRLEEGPLGAAWRARRSRVPVTAVTLGPLAEREALALAAAWGLGSDGLAREAVARSEGNPFFLEQLARAGGEAHDVPGAVQSLVLARLDQLPEAARVALRAACVLGQRVATGALEAIAPGAAAWVETLAEAGLLLAEAGDSWLISHSLVREAVYRSCLEGDRIRWHERAAAYYAERDPVLWAEHLERAGDMRAGEAFLAAARAELAAHRHEHGLALARRGLALAREARLRCRLLLAIGEEHRALGEVEAAREAFGEALVEAGSDAERCRARLGLADVLRLTDATDEALALLDQAEQEARRAGSLEGRSHVHYLRGCLLFPTGALDRCLVEHEKALELARQAGSPAHEARALSGLGDASYLRGRMSSARSHIDRCLAVCREHGLGRIEVANLAMAAVLALYDLEAEAAYRGCWEAARRARLVGNRRAELIALSNTLDVHLFRGEWEQAAADAQACLAVCQSTGSGRFTALTKTIACFARAASGEDGWLSDLRQSVAQVRATGASFYGPTALGMLALSTSDEEERRRALEQGEALLAAGAASHNHLQFAPLAMLAGLHSGDWEGVNRRAERLRAYAAGEPLPWSEVIGRWGEVLAGYGRSEVEREGLLAVHERLAGSGLGVLLRPLERALAGEPPARAFRWPQGGSA